MQKKEKSDATLTMDQEILSNIVKGVGYHQPSDHSKPYDKWRAAVCVVLRLKESCVRFHSDELQSDSKYSGGNSTSPQSVDFFEPLPPTRFDKEIINGELGNMEFLRAFFASNPWTRQATLEILYLKRATNLKDRHSDQVSFPGGKHEPQDESDLLTGVRETFEECGLDLLDQSKFRYLGRLNDLFIKEKKNKEWVSSSVGAYTWLQIARETPPLRLSQGEIAAFRWVPAQLFLRRSYFLRKCVYTSPEPYPVPFTGGWLRVSAFQYPMIDLPPFYDPVAFSDFDFVLWGLTLNLTNTLFKTAGYPSMLVPQFTTPGHAWYTAFLSLLQVAKELWARPVLTLEIAKALMIPNNCLTAPLIEKPPFKSKL